MDASAAGSSLGLLEERLKSLARSIRELGFPDGVCSVLTAKAVQNAYFLRLKAEDRGESPDRTFVKVFWALKKGGVDDVALADAIARWPLDIVQAAFAGAWSEEYASSRVGDEPALE